jgi:D-alanyl-D-alanine carboxypeptidase
LRNLIFLNLLIYVSVNVCIAQKAKYDKQIDSLIHIKTNEPFNGTILISQNGKTKYSKTFGYADLDKKTPIKFSDQFVIGSISKQITAVLVLREYDKGNINLNIPIKKYLPKLSQTWADSVTVHQLLTHTHGIQQLDKPLAFKAGTQFSYSQIGYHHLTQILEKITNKSFAILSEELFNQCKMEHSFHPDLKKYKSLVKAYTQQENGDLAIEIDYLKNYAAAGSFISNAKDLALWNQNLFEAKLLSDSTLKLMTIKQKNATRDHPIFGKTDYGYGITVDTKDNILQLGQTGFAPGFVSMNFYFPETKTSVIVFENVAYHTDDLKRTFYYHTKILKIIRESDLVGKKSVDL